MSVAGNQNDQSAEYIYSLTSGLYRFLAQFMGEHTGTAMYKFIQSLERGIFRMDDVMIMMQKYNSYHVTDPTFAEGEWLEDLGKMMGVTRISSESDRSLKYRIFAVWDDLIGGGTPQSLKTTLYYFIGEPGFTPQTPEETPYIYFENAGSGVIEWYATDATSGTEEWVATDASSGTYEWIFDNTFPEEFRVNIDLVSGSSSNPITWQYWDQDTKISQLYDIINAVKPVGYTFSIKLNERI